MKPIRIQCERMEWELKSTAHKVWDTKYNRYESIRNIPIITFNHIKYQLHTQELCSIHI